MNKPVLYIVVPCYNEEKVLPVTCEAFKAQLCGLLEKGKISDRSCVIFVDDGSFDSTWEIIRNLSERDKCFKGVRLSRNRGHQNAVLAGLTESKDKCDIAISIDCDGQDDITVIEKMVDAYEKGSDIVYGVRECRKADSFFKRFTARMYYKLLKFMGVETVYDHADFRLTSKRVLDALSDYNEVNLYLRGLFPLIGFKTSKVYYKRQKREAGQSHYSFSKTLSLAGDGITSFSVKPLKLISAVGIIMTALSIVGLFYEPFVSVICLCIGIQIICMGIVGEYTGKIYMETKARPRYTIMERTE